MICSALWGGIWSEPELIGFETSAYLAVDNQGACWCGGGPWIYTYRGDALGWQAVTETPFGGHTCFDKGDTLWLWAGNDWAIYYSRWDGENWSEVDTVPTYPSANFFSKITADSTNGVWVTWSTDWVGFWAVAYNRYRNGAWGEPQVVTDTLEEVDHDIECITTDAYGRVWFGWREIGYGPYMGPLKAVYRDGDTWGETMIVSAEECWSCGGLRLTPDRKGGIWASWGYQKEKDSLPVTVLSYWDGGSWSSVDTIAIGYVGPHFAADAENNMWLVWSKEVSDEDYDIYCSVNQGSGWSEPAPVSEHPAVDQWPDIAVDDAGRIWCVWSSNREGEDEWDYSIWASYATVVGVEEPIPPVTPVTHRLPSLTIDKSVGGEFTFSVSHSNIVRGIVICDASGRVVRDLTICNNQTIHWDGTDANGQALSPGVYFVKLSPNTSSLKLVLIR